MDFSTIAMLAAELSTGKRALYSEPGIADPIQLREHVTLEETEGKVLVVLNLQTMRGSVSIPYATRYFTFTETNEVTLLP